VSLFNVFGGKSATRLDLLVEVL
jgi:hypothetical protein